MKVVIIGAGNVATVFGRLIKKADHEVMQVYSRKIATARILAEELLCAYTDDRLTINPSADIYIVAMSDAALNDIRESFDFGDNTVVHTAGSISRDILKDISTNYGVLYPLQSLRKENTNTPLIIPLLVDGNTEACTAHIEAFAKTISPNVMRTTDDERLKMHVAAVVVNNFTNHRYDLASEYCKEENLDFKMLLPLIEETATRLQNFTAHEVQTGPAIRKDIVTLDKHLRILSNHPKLRTVYLRLTDSIMNP
jgi:predicted short-subunit dehydrogenase-like oxidoreductase (DUF2520 family)